LPDGLPELLLVDGPTELRIANLAINVGELISVEYAEGSDPIGPGVLLPGLPAIPSGFFSQESPGLTAEYWDNPNFTLVKVKEALDGSAFQSVWEEGSQWTLEETGRKVLGDDM